MRYRAGVVVLASCGLLAAFAGHSQAAAHSGKMLPGSTVTSRLHLGAETLAAGAMFGRAAQKAGPKCATGCNPVVWVSDGSGWRVVLKVPATGSIADERLFAAPFGVLLFNSDEGLSIWRSDKGRHWVAQPLPGAMASGVLTHVSRHGHDVVVRTEPKRGNRQTWFTTDGRSWRRRR